MASTNINSHSRRAAQTEKFDYVIVGASLSGLLAAKALRARGSRVLILEAHDEVGGSNRGLKSQIAMSDRTFKFFPETGFAEEVFTWLETILETSIARTIIEEPAVTFEDGRFKPFVGFGDANIKTGSEISAYARARYYQLQLTPKDWVHTLREQLGDAIVTQSVVTAIEVDENSLVTQLVVNGEKTILAKQVLFCANPVPLLQLLPSAKVPAKVRQRLSKGEFYTSVNLELTHSAPVTESAAIHILRGGSEEPAVGVFNRPIKLSDGSTVQTSQWLTLLARDMSDDIEAAAFAIKQIKRQIKRAYETALENIVSERIFVNPLSHGDLQGALPADGRWPKVENLWLISGSLNHERNLWGTLLQTRLSLSSVYSASGDSASGDSGANRLAADRDNPLLTAQSEIQSEAAL